QPQRDARRFHDRIVGVERRRRGAGRRRRAGDARRGVDMMPRMVSLKQSAVGSCSLAATVVAVGLLAAGVGHAQKRQRLNPMIDLLEQKKPVFGVYWPSNPSGRGRAGAPPPPATPPKSPAELARDALAYAPADFLFSGAMEGGVDRAIGPVSDFIKATADAGALTKTPFLRFPH